MDLRELQEGRGGAAGAVARAGLSAAAGLYALAVAGRNALLAVGALPARRLPVPVVSVGNLTAGGTGKTPFVAWLCARALAAGRRPAVLSRGYGPKPAGASLSDEGVVLDEALGGRVPVVEDPCRRRGGSRLLASRPGVDLVVLDDGFQHRRLARDADVVLLDATDPFGGGLLLPRGRLREPRSALARADAIVVTRSERAGPARVAEVLEEAARRAPGAVRAVARTVATGLVGPGGDVVPLARLRGERVLAWAGVGNPAAFEGTLADAGAVVAGRLAAADHHAPDAADVRRAASAAAACGASRVVVTRKDLVKLRALPGLPAGLWALDAATEVVEGEADLLRVALPAARVS